MRERLARVMRAVLVVPWIAAGVLAVCVVTAMEIHEAEEREREERDRAEREGFV